MDLPHDGESRVKFITPAQTSAELAELVDALDSGSSGSNAFGVQVPGSASKFQIVDCRFEIE